MNIPRGICGDQSGNGCWYMRERDEAENAKASVVAGRKACLSDPHRIAADRTVQTALDHFHKTANFNALVKRTRYEYGRYRATGSKLSMKLGMRSANSQQPD